MSNWFKKISNTVKKTAYKVSHWIVDKHIELGLLISKNNKVLKTTKKIIDDCYESKLEEFDNE